MDQDEAVCVLKAKRADLMGEIARLKDDVAALDRAIVILSGDTASSAPVRRRRAAGSGVLADIFGRNELKTLVLKSVREHGDDGVSVPAIADEVLLAKELPPDMSPVRKAIESHISAHLSSLKTKGILTNGTQDVDGRSTYTLVRSP